MTEVGPALGMHYDKRKWGRSKNIADNDTFVGIEIELEHLGNFTHNPWQKNLIESGLWNITKDGSLRDHGLEFIMQTPSTEPLKGEDVDDALKKFKNTMDEYIKKFGDPPRCTNRTSLHVHVDVRDLSITQLKKYLLLYTAFEKILFNWAAPERFDNNYCRCVDYHRDIVERIVEIINTDESDMLAGRFARTLDNGNKYDAMNVLSIRQRGSIEFRLMRGTYDVDLIRQWINILLAMKRSALDEDIIIDSFPEDMSTRGLDNLIDQVFGKWGECLKEHATNMDVLEGVRRAQDILLDKAMSDLDSQFTSHSEKTNSHLNAFKAKIEV